VDRPFFIPQNIVQESAEPMDAHGCNDRLRLDGKPWNHKRVLRVYREMRLNLPRRTKKRVPRRERHTLEVPEAANAIWAIDFMSDALYQGRRFRIDKNEPIMKRSRK